jgi:hypothetical protein
MRYLFHVICSVVLAAGCNNPGEINTTESSDDVRHEIISMFDDYHKDIADQGLLGEFKYLDASTDFFWIPPGFHSALSYDSVRVILETTASAFKDIEFRWDMLTIFPLAPDIATYHGIVVGSMTDTANTRFPVRILESGTVIKRVDGWKLLSGQSRSLIPDIE